MEARTSAERFQLLQEALLSRLCHGVEQHYAVSAALGNVREESSGAESQGGRKVSWSKASVGSFRFSRRKWSITPKLFNRIQRFQQAGLSSKQSFDQLGGPCR